MLNESFHKSVISLQPQQYQRSENKTEKKRVKTFIIIKTHRIKWPAYLLQQLNQRMTQKLLFPSWEKPPLDATTVIGFPLETLTYIWYQRSVNQSFLNPKSKKSPYIDLEEIIFSFIFYRWTNRPSDIWKQLRKRELTFNKYSEGWRNKLRGNSHWMGGVRWEKEMNS